MRHYKMRRLITALVLAAALTGGALAQQAASPSDEQVKERLAFLENALESAQPRAKLWWYGWIAGYSGGAAVQGILTAANWKKDKDDNEFAQDMLVGGVTCALGAGGLLISPFGPAYKPSGLKSMPEGTPEERQAKLLRAEEILRECAQRERYGRGWLTHGLNLGVNVVAGLVTVLAFDRPWSDGLVTFAINETVSLLNIFSQPRRAQRDLKSYEAGHLDKPGVDRNTESRLSFYWSVRPGGISLGFRF